MTNFSFLTLEETLEHQKHLGELCADRPLITNEIFTWNAFYGNDAIIKIYAGLPRAKPIKVILPHGINVTNEFASMAELQFPLPAVFCYPPYIKNIFQDKTEKVIFLSSSPYCYLVELLKTQPKPKRKGTIFFPSHSTHHVTSKFDFERVAKKLTGLDEELQPVTVCMYWRDYNLGKHRPFQKRGFQIVSAGHIYDSNFLFRFYHLCSMHQYSASNSIGTNLFYSMKSGCSFFLLNSGGIAYVASPDILRREGCNKNIPPHRKSYLEEAFQVPQFHITEAQKEIMDYYLGTRYLKSPEDLRRQLSKADHLDKFGFVISNKKGLKKIVMPSYYRRCRIYPGLEKIYKKIMFH